jgi:hypothetical protein
MGICCLIDRAFSSFLFEIESKKQRCLCPVLESRETVEVSCKIICLNLMICSPCPFVYTFNNAESAQILYLCYYLWFSIVFLIYLYYPYYQIWLLVLVALFSDWYGNTLLLCLVCLSQCCLCKTTIVSHSVLYNVFILCC